MQALRFELTHAEPNLSASHAVSADNCWGQASGRLPPWNRIQADAATVGAALPANSSNACTAFAAYISEGPPPI